MGKLALAEQLIACGSDVNEAPRGKNITPLLAATLSQHTDILNLLLRSGCQLGAVGPDGSTALHMAACAGCPNSIRWLLENGADPLAPNDFKCRPSQMISPDIEPATREEALGLLWAAEQQAGFVDPATQAPGAALGWTEEESPIMVLEVRAREAIAEGRLEEALAHYAELHTAMLQGGHASSAANALRAMAQVEIQMGHFSAASTHLQDALSVYRAAGDRQMEGHVLNEVGICRREEGDYDAALASFKSAMDACHESRDGDLLWHVHNNTGGVLLGAGKTEEGMLEFCHSLEIAIALGGDKPRGIEARAIANSRHNIGCALIKLGREEAAVEELEEALRGKTDVKDWAGMRSTLAMLAQAEGALGHVDEATEYVVTLSKLERGKMGKPPQEACLVCWGALEGRPTLEVEGGVGAKEDGLCTALGCYHVFHVHCLAAWRAKAPKSKKEAACPSCGKKAPAAGVELD
mmetsp:Transcript_22829/g.70942  ORF Transcript_22829/g.70942 Transcript_22829/m.70942 type:complete len:466 (-) Transcript_22829:932-2329(-)